MKIASLINYCTNDYRFIKKTIDNVLPFSSQVIVSVCDHFFTGEEENRELLDKTYKENPKAQFIEYEWTSNYCTQYWSNMSRLLEVNNVNTDVDWLLLLDSDEIVDTELFIDWLNTIKLNCDAYNLANYFYFREPIYQAIQQEDSVVFVKKELVKPNVFNFNNEREQYTKMLVNASNMRYVKHNNMTMVDHYSWVRTKEQMLKKVQTWWHKDDRDWTSLVEKEFSHEFTGVDFIHGYKYITVKNRWSL